MTKEIWPNFLPEIMVTSPIIEQVIQLLLELRSYCMVLVVKGFPGFLRKSL
jgi:hypothetical protein